MSLTSNDGACLSTATLHAARLGKLEGPALEAMETHIGGCAACRAQLAAALRLEPALALPEVRTATAASPGSTGSVATATLWGRLYATRGLPLFFVLAALCVGLLVIEARAVAVRLSTPDIGLDLYRRGEGLMLSRVDARWSGISPGMQLVSLAGVRLNAADQDQFSRIRSTLPLGPLQATFSVGGTEVALQAEALPTPWFEQVIALIAALGGAVLFALGLLSFLLNPGERLSWLFLFFCIGLGTAITVAQGYTLPSKVLYTLLLPLLSFTTAVGLDLFNRLPEPSRFIKRRGALGALYAIAGALSVSHLLTIATHQRNSSLWVLVTEMTVRTFTLLGTLAIIVRMARGLWRSRRAGADRLASQYRLLLVGWAVGVAPPAAHAFVSRLSPSAGTGQELTGTSLVLFAIATLIALVQHNPLRADHYLGQILGYTVAVGGLTVSLALAVIGVPLLAQTAGFASSPQILVVLVAVLFFVQAPVYRRVRRRIDAWFRAERADAQGRTLHLNALVRTVQNDPLERVCEQVETSVSAVLGAETVQLWRDLGDGTLMLPGAMAPLQIDSELVRALRAGPAGVKSLAPVVLAQSLQDELWRLGMAVAAPVMTHGQLSGLLGVSRKASGFAYDREELDWLSLIASQVGIAIERSGLQLRLGRYRLERRLAVGGMAEVFLASQLGPGGFERKVAIKRLLPELAEDAQSAAMLLDEARIAAQLQHPHIAQTWEVGQESGSYFLAMEYVDGVSLRKLMLGGGPAVPLNVFLTIAQAVLDALDYAHHAVNDAGAPLGVVHRDVTPANVLVSARGDVKLVDFGIAVARDRLYRTQTGMVRGTLPYMSPEQAHREDIDLRSDVYSVAATLYELLVGRRAFPNGPTGARPALASHVQPEVPDALAQALDTAMATDRAARTATARELSAQLAGSLFPLRAAGAAELARWVKERLAEARPEVPASDVETQPMRR